MTRLTTLDLPQLHRATVGFDRMFDEMNRAFENTKSTGYPPYNVVEINEDEYMISLAVAGFGMDNLDITLEKNVLTVEGNAPKGDEEVNYLHKGIGGRLGKCSPCKSIVWLLVGGQTKIVDHLWQQRLLEIEFIVIKYEHSLIGRHGIR